MNALESASSPRQSSTQNASRFTMKRIPKLTTTASERLTANANHCPSDAGEHERVEERADQERRQAAREQLVAGAAEVFGEVRALQVDRALEVGDDVAGLDARREVDPVPHRDRHDQRLRQPRVGGGLVGRVAADRPAGAERGEQDGDAEEAEGGVGQHARDAWPRGRTTTAGTRLGPAPDRPCANAPDARRDPGRRPGWGCERNPARPERAWISPPGRG